MDDIKGILVEECRKADATIEKGYINLGNSCRGFDKGLQHEKRMLKVSQKTNRNRVRGFWQQNIMMTLGIIIGIILGIVFAIWTYAQLM